MKQHTLTSTLSVFFVLATSSVTQAQPGPTNFPMVGITRGQTLVLNVVAFPPSPCAAQLAFQNSSGGPVGPTQTVILAPGQSASLPLNGNSVATTIGQRVELLPTVLLSPTVANSCVASAEVIDNLLGVTMVL